MSRIYLEEAEAANQGGNPVLTLVAQDPLHVEFHLPSEEVGELQMDQKIPLQLEGGEVIHGRVILISPMIDPATQTRRIKLELPNPNSVLPSGLRTIFIKPTSPGN